MAINSVTPEKEERLHLQLISIMIGFFVMGSIEMVGIASNFIKLDLHISDAKANLIPSLVYIWFFIITIPTGILMHKIGREKTVLLSLLLIALSMFIPFFGKSYHIMILCFVLLGISNVSLQTSLYPLLSGLISGKQLAGEYTIGQLIKTLSSFCAPYIAMLGALYFSHIYHLGWHLLFIFYFAITLLAIIMIDSSKFYKKPGEVKVVTFKTCLKQLKDPLVLLAFIGVMCHVGIDISTNTVAPKILMSRLQMPIEDASFGSSLYFMARLGGCLFWAVFLKKVANKDFFYISIFLILAALTGLFFAETKATIYCCLVVIGFGNANLFPVLFSQAILDTPQNKDIISVLMIMGQAGGALFPYSMGLVFDHAGLNGSLSILMIGVLYLVFYSFHLKRKTRTE